MWTAELLGISCHNLAQGGAGNTYISNSIIDYLETAQLDPVETVVMAMWSGTSRKDITVGEEFWDNLDYSYKFKSANNNYYVSSCGTGNAWQDSRETQQLFKMLYVGSDSTSLCRDSVRNFLNLENYLTANSYKFKFTGFYNLWESADKSTSAVGDPLLNKYDHRVDMKNWFFVNHNRDSFWEFANSKKLLDRDQWHPNDQAHQQYAEQIVAPTLQEYFK